MKKYLGLLKYSKPYRTNIFLYFLFTLLSIVFSVVSIGMLFPFMDIIFTGGALVTQKPEAGLNAASMLKSLQY
jgi:subfamily B ATP-binding cassette protein MsbA